VLALLLVPETRSVIATFWAAGAFFRSPLVQEVALIQTDVEGGNNGPTRSADFDHLLSQRSPEGADEATGRGWLQNDAEGRPE
jgi:hypothetical protein